MPVYSYVALVGGSKRSRGHIDAGSLEEAKQRLREQGVMVTQLKPSTRLARRSALSRTDLINFTAQLSQLVRSGLPLFESLLALEEQYRAERSHRILVSLCEQIRGGKSLSEALEEHPGSFSRLYVAMVAAGESSGTLDRVLHKLSELLKAQAKLRKSLVTALTYPAVIGAFCTAVIVLLLTFAIPSMEGLMEGRQLNGFTGAVFGVSHFLGGWWGLYLPLALVAALSLFYTLRSPAGRSALDRLMLKTPFLKTLVLQSAFARFTETLATLQEGGVNMIDSLRLCQRVMGNQQLEEIIARAESRIVAGSSLAAELKSEPVVPRLVGRMLLVGEESGEITPMLRHIRDVYTSELERSLSRMTALIQPAILIIMGGVIGIIMLAVLLPLSDMSSFT